MEFKISQIRFWGPQDDGQSEYILKDELVALFEQHVEVRSAYLAVVDYGESTQMSIALCLDVGTDQNGALREEIQTVFRSLFKEGVHMDILFLTKDLIAGLQTRCPPFYQQGTPSRTAN